MALLKDDASVERKDCKMSHPSLSQTAILHNLFIKGPEP